jgi:hypothetical protein
MHRFASKNLTKTGRIYEVGIIGAGQIGGNSLEG